jgi:hypothetical protein
VLAINKTKMVKTVDRLSAQANRHVIANFLPAYRDFIVNGSMVEKH